MSSAAQDDGEEGDEGDEEDEEDEDDGPTPLELPDRRSALPSPVCQAGKVKRWNLEF